MILVDTSVLIGYFKGLSGAPYNLLDQIIEQNLSFGINNLIYQELLQGAKTEQEFNSLKEYLETLTFYNLHYGKESYCNVAKLYMQCRKKGVTVRSSIDLIIAETAIENGLYLLHNDNDFINIAKVIKTLKLYN